MAAALHLRHPEPLLLALDRLGRECLLPLPTRGQMRRAIELDPEPGAEESPADMDARRSLQLEILAEGSDLPVELLTAEEEVQVLHAIVAAHHGYDPAHAVALQQTLKKKALLAAPLAVSMDSTATASSSPSS